MFSARMERPGQGLVDAVDFLRIDAFSKPSAQQRNLLGQFTLLNGQKIELSPGGQNVLIKEIIDKFCAYYTPGGDVLYVGDAGAKFPIWEKEELARLGVTVDEHGKMASPAKLQIRSMGTSALR